MNALISTDQASELINQLKFPTKTTSLSLEKCATHTLAETIFADRPFPPFDRSMMDGFATKIKFLKTDTKRHLKILGTIAAGQTPPNKTPENSAWEIMTGAVVPKDCDVIIPVEQTEKNNANSPFIKITSSSFQIGQFIHKEGSDFQKNAELISPYTTIKSRQIAIAASVGKTHLTTITPPKVSIITTGDEIIPIDQNPSPIQIRQSNGIALQAALSNYPIEIIKLIHINDDLSNTKKTIKEALLNSDLILTTGGISKGKFDFIRQAVTTYFGTPIFHGVAQKPGKPLALWHQNHEGKSTTLFALPGNPISVSVTFHTYVTQFLARWFHQKHPSQKVQLSQDFQIKKAIPLEFFTPASLSPIHSNQAKLHSLQNSGDLASSIHTTGFVKLPADNNFFPAQTSVNYYPWL